MNVFNLVIIITLLLSPLVYLPIISRKNNIDLKGFNWYIMTFSVGLIQALSYLVILILLEIPL